MHKNIVFKINFFNTFTIRKKWRLFRFDSKLLINFNFNLIIISLLFNLNYFRH